MDAIIYKRLAAELDKGKKAVLLSTFDKAAGNATGEVNKRLWTVEELADAQAGLSVNEDSLALARKALASGEITLAKFKQALKLAEPFFPVPRLVIMGGGHIALPLAEYGARLGFAVTVVDDRADFANKLRFPQARQIICGDFQQCFSCLNLNKSAFVVIVTRGHSHDLDCLRQALLYDVAYLGMIGSRNKVRQVREKLLTQSVDSEKLDRVYAPIGLDIGAVTPEEIAISILAQIIAVRRRGLGAASDTVNWPEYDAAVIQQLATDASGAALITLVAAKGSVPRRAGAKMLVWADGRTLGSVGGGYGEAVLVKKAGEIAIKGGYVTQSLDLTGRIAAETGMICGGSLTAVIEACRKNE